MKYLITGREGNVVNPRLLDAAPNPLPPGRTANAITNAAAAVMQATLDGKLDVQRAFYIDGQLVLKDPVDLAVSQPFIQQLKSVIREVPRALRSRIIDVIAPGLALDDVEVMADKLNALDLTSRPARIQKIQADLLTVIGREVARRAQL